MDANVIANLILQIVIMALVIYVGWHFRTRIQTLQATANTQKDAIDALKATIDALAEQLKVQSTVLQDFERLNKAMKLMLDTVSDPAALQREQAYKARVDRDVAALLEQQARELGEKGQQTVEQVRHRYLDVLGGAMNFIATLLLYVSFEHRTELIETAKLSPSIKTSLRRFAREAPYCLDMGILAELRPPLEPQALEEEDAP